MTVCNQPYGWQPETTDATVYTSTAYSRGDIVMLLGRFDITADPQAGVPGFSRAYTPSGARVLDTGTVYAVALEDATAASTFKVRIRGRCEALVEKDVTDILLNATLVPGRGEITDNNAMMLSTDINSGTVVSPSARKIVALSEGAHTSVTAGLIVVLFNGAEGFGTEVGSTPS